MMWGTAPIPVLADRLQSEGQAVFPLTDRNGLNGMVEHLKICAERDLRPIVGCELTDRHGHQALCLVKTRQGYQHLCALLTDQYRQERWHLVDALLDRHEGLILISQTDALFQQLYPAADLYIDLHPGGVRQARQLKQHYDAPLVATCHAYMLSPKAYPLHQLLRAIDTNSKLSRLPPHAVQSRDSYLLSRDAMQQRFANFPEALHATAAIIEACEYVPAIGKPIFPPSDYDHHFKALRDKTYAGLVRRYGRLRPDVRQRADYELDMIRRKGFANCFLVVEDVVSRFSLTCGRGSAAASIVAYALHITHVDPIAQNLLFERFLNPGRTDPPDIDIDFAWDERDHVRDYLWDKYGGQHIGMVCNHNRLRLPSAIREIAKVYGLGDNEIATIRFQLLKARKQGRPPDLPDPWPRILKLAERLEDYPRHLSVHCGGVVITPDPIIHHCPLRPMPIGYAVVPWDKDGVEDYGFVKLDFLGNRSLAVIRDCIQAVRENYGVPLTYANLQPTGDPQAQALIRNGNTIGCFYVESPATRLLLQKTGHGDFDTLVVISSIIRPAANKIALEWVRRHRWRRAGHQANWPPIHPKLEDALQETHGLMVFQEDVTRVAMALADFDAFQGDRLRKILSKKHPQKLADYRCKFSEGCLRNGLNRDQIDAIWEMVASFAGYSFCKPHSASYALVSFKSAFLKFHYPAEFMAAVIANQGGFYSSYAYLSHARRIGIHILGPDINDSTRQCRGYKGCLRMGFDQIKGLPRAAIDLILQAREPEPFMDFRDFLYRVSLGLEATKRLILAGCFDAWEANRPNLIWQTLHWFAQHRDQTEDLFPTLDGDEDLPTMEPYALKTKLALEKKLFGYWISAHPLTPYFARFDDGERTLACDLPQRLYRHVVLAGWLITAKTVTTIHDEPMSFLTFEDETGFYETVLFPDAYKQYAADIQRDRPYAVHGEVVEEMGAITLTITQITPLTQEVNV